MRDVGAGDQEHEAHRREQDPEHRAGISPKRASSRSANGLLAAVGPGMRLFELGHDAVELGPRRLERRARRQPARGRASPSGCPGRARTLGALQADRRVESTGSARNAKKSGSTPTIATVRRAGSAARRWGPRRNAACQTPCERGRRAALRAGRPALRASAERGPDAEERKTGAEISAPTQRSGSPAPAEFQRVVRNPASSSDGFVPSVEERQPRDAHRGPGARSDAREPHEPVGLGIGERRSSTAWTTLKIAVLAPMPRASVATATAVKPGP